MEKITLTLRTTDGTIMMDAEIHPLFEEHCSTLARELTEELPGTTAEVTHKFESAKKEPFKKKSSTSVS